MTTTALPFLPVAQSEPATCAGPNCALSSGSAETLELPLERWLHRERDRPKKHLSIRGWNDLVDLLSLVGDVPFEATAYLAKIHECVPGSRGRIHALADATQADWMNFLWECERRRPDLAQCLRNRRAEAESSPNEKGEQRSPASTKPK